MTEPLTCPVPRAFNDQVLLAHGEGARLTRQLIRNLLASAFDNEFLRPLGDGAVLPAMNGRLVFSTDSYVVSPLFFPGGDIGRLSVFGTINDLAACGAEPKYISVAFIIEEGLPWPTLTRVVASIRAAADICGVAIVTGDTKVVPRGAADGLFVNTTGIGQLRDDTDIGAYRVRAGDRIIVTGTIGDHGVAVLSAREQFDLGSALQSDSAPLHIMVERLLQTGIDVHFMRDPTRGGVSAALHELTETTGLSAIIDETTLPLSPPVRGACELLGLDPLYVANEGKMLIIVSPNDVERTLNDVRRWEYGRNAQVIGEIVPKEPEAVLVRTALGLTRVLDEPSGAPLPRIC